MGYKRKNEAFQHLDFMILDILMIELSLVFAYWLRFGTSGDAMLEAYKRIAVTSGLLYICIVFFMEPHSGIIRRGHFIELKKVVSTNLCLLIGLILYVFIMHLGYSYSRLVLGFFFVINSGLSIIAHILWKELIRRRFGDENYRNHLLIVTKREYLQSCINRLAKDPYGMMKIVGILLLEDVDLEEDKEREVDGIPIVGTKNQLFLYCKSHVVDDVLFYLKDENVEELTEKLVDMGTVVHMNLLQVEENHLKYNVSVVNGMLTLTTCMNYVAAWQMAVKRFVDITCGVIGCVCTGIIFLFVAPIIKIQSPGPVFFSQTRVGKNGRKFKIYKFRSMYKDAEERKKELMAQNKVKDGLMFKMDEDPRIFPFGNFLRRTSLDEFPQFLNILKGEMSLIGTRPPTVEEWELYEPRHQKRLSMKPGLTGMWQVSGRSNVTDFEKVVEMDTRYMVEWSLSLDLKIFLKTIWVVLKSEGSV